MCPQALGAVSVRHFARLMPLLLRWLHAPTTRTQDAAVAALQAVVLGCWPRVGVHAPLLWRHLQVRSDSVPHLSQEVAAEGLQVFEVSRRRL